MTDGSRERPEPKPNARRAQNGNSGPGTRLGDRDWPIPIDDDNSTEGDRPQELTANRERRNIPVAGRNPGDQMMPPHIARSGQQPQLLASNSNARSQPEHTSSRNSSASETSSRPPVSTDGSLYSPSPRPATSRPRRQRANSIDGAFVVSDSEDSVDSGASYQDPGAESDDEDGEDSSGDTSGESSGEEMESVEAYSTDSSDEEMAENTSEDGSTYKDTGESSSEDDSTDEADRGQVWVFREKK